MLTKSDFAKYPFISEAARYVKTLDIKINELSSPEYELILDRAKDRIEEAILFQSVSEQSRNDDIEILSFPIAVMMVAATANIYLKRSYALAEAKRVSNLLKNESKENIIEVANNFGWKIKSIKDHIGSLTYDVALHFTDFLKNAPIFHEKEWKLINQVVVNGEVYLTKNRAARLLEEEVRRHIEGKLAIKVGSLSPKIMNHVERLNQLFNEKRGKTSFEDFPKEVVVAAFPPCLKSLYDATASGQRISHIGRFALTSFLINIGMPVENVVDLLRSFSDFNERMTRYQVEHIAGKRGSRTKYTPPRCDTLRTHGICPEMNEICRTISHPLTYYRRKLRAVKAEVTS